MALLASKQTYFELVHLAGEGLNSCVYKALRRDATETISQTVALKILKSKDSVLFWRQEVQSLLQVNSPYCVKVFDFEWINNQPAMVLEWLDGVTLAELFGSFDLSGPLVQEILIQVQEGLVDLHLSNLCHGDLHMENILITNEGQIKLLDFGLANESRFKLQGAPEVRAPELNSEHGRPSLWSDLYALGVIAKQLGRDCPKLTAPLPENRDLMEGSSCLDQRIQLADHVQNLLKKREILCLHKTYVCHSETSRSRLHWGARLLGFLLMLSLAPGASSSLYQHPPCLIEVRTREWHEVRVNDKPSRFSPADFLVHSCGPIHVNWKNEQGQGSIQLSLKRGEWIRLRDKDFR